MINTISFTTIKSYAQKIAEKFNPEMIILFGSYGMGLERPDSDVDIMVILKHKGKSPDMAYNIRKNIKHEFPLDLLVRKPKDVEQRINSGDPFLKDILKNGKVLYEKNNSGMAKQS